MAVQRRAVGRWEQVMPDWFLQLHPGVQVACILASAAIVYKLIDSIGRVL